MKTTLSIGRLDWPRAKTQLDLAGFVYDAVGSPSGVAILVSFIDKGQAALAKLRLTVRAKLVP